jgi:hypothetical protein
MEKLEYTLPVCSQIMTNNNYVARLGDVSFVRGSLGIEIDAMGELSSTVHRCHTKNL